jgi:hypothetical protein
MNYLSFLRSHGRMFLGILIFFFMFDAIGLILPERVYSGDASLAWDANTEPDISGYKVYYGTGSNNYTTNVNVGNFTGCVLSGLTAGLTYYFAATAYDAGGLESGYSNEVSYTIPSPAAGATTFAVNAGGAKYTTTGGIAFSADARYSGGSTATTRSSISGTSDGKLYQSQRTGNFSYNIPLASGNYSLALKFAEISSRVGRGRRVFNVLVGGNVVINHLDIYAMAGANRAYDVTVPVSVANGSLNIQFQSVVGSAVVNAIRVAN